MSLELRVRHLEELVVELREQVRELQARLEEVTSPLGFDLVQQPAPSSPSPQVDRVAPSPVHPMTPSPAASTPCLTAWNTGPAPSLPERSPPSVTATERAAACREIGLFLRRSLDGGHRGTSGRDRLPLQSRYWLVVREVFSPIKVCRSLSECAAACKRGSDCGDSIFVGLPARQDILSVCAAANLVYPTAGEMEEDLAGVDGEVLAAACVGEGFLDPLAPLCFLACGEDDEGFPVTVHCVVVGDVQGKLLICLPAAAWHRKVAKITVPRGFLSKVIAAEVAAVSMLDRAAELPGQTVRVWLGFCEGDAEQSIQVSDAAPSVNFGALPNGDLLVPFAEALALLWQHQVSGTATTPLHTANEGTEAQASLPERLASIERTLAWLVSPSGAGLDLPAPPQQVSRAKACPATARSEALWPHLARQSWERRSFTPASTRALLQLPWLQASNRTCLAR